METFLIKAVIILSCQDKGKTQNSIPGILKEFFSFIKRSAVICFSAFLGLALSAPIADSTDTSIPTIFHPSLTNIQDADLDLDETQFANNTVTGTEEPDNLIQASKPTDATVASDHEISQSLGIEPTQPQVVALFTDDVDEKILKWTATVCADFSLVDSGRCDFVVDNQYTGWYATVQCEHGSKNCRWCLAQNPNTGVCEHFETVTRSKIGHLPSLQSRKGQPWCKTDICGPSSPDSPAVPKESSECLTGDFFLLKCGF